MMGDFLFDGSKQRRWWKLRSDGDIDVGEGGGIPTEQEAKLLDGLEASRIGLEDLLLRLEGFKQGHLLFEACAIAEGFALEGELGDALVKVGERAVDLDFAGGLASGVQGEQKIPMDGEFCLLKAEACDLEGDLCGLLVATPSPTDRHIPTQGGFDIGLPRCGVGSRTLLERLGLCAAFEGEGRVGGKSRKSLLTGLCHKALSAELSECGVVLVSKAPRLLGSQARRTFCTHQRSRKKPHKKQSSHSAT